LRSPLRDSLTTTREPAGERAGKNPAISVIVPTFGRADAIGRCVAALRAQQPVDGGFEIVVVDDGSPEPVRVSPADTGPPVRVVRQPNSGPACARNRGAAESRGALLAFTDDDCAPEPGWLAAMARAHADDPDALLGGVTVNAARNSVPAQASQDLLAFLYRDMQNRVYDAPFFASNNLACSAHRFAAVGAFDTSFPLAAGEDRELGDRWHHAGHALTLVSRARVRHFHAMNVKDYWRQHHNYGRGALHFQNARTRFGRAGLKPEGPGFYRGMLGEPWRAVERGARLRRSLLIALAQLATAAGYAAERRRLAVSAPAAR